MKEGVIKKKKKERPNGQTNERKNEQVEHVFVYIPMYIFIFNPSL